jgi:hypothetical protein
MSEAIQIIEIEPLVAQIKALAPIFEKSLKAEAQLKEQHDYLQELLEEWDGQANEEITEALNNATVLLGHSKSAYEKWNALREAVTKPLDELKKQLMVPEKRVAPDGKTDNYYTKIRETLAKAENIKIARVKREEAKAEAEKEKAIAKVDLQTQIKKNLSQMVIDRVVFLEEWSQKHFDAATVDNFDEVAAKYQAIKPALKQDLYDKCFNTVIANAKLSTEEVNAVKNDLKQIEPFTKWEEAIIQGAMPVLNAWRARIDQLKQEKIAIAQADGDKKKQLEDAKAKRDAEALAESQKLAEAAKQQSDQAIAQDAELNKMEAQFQEQAVVQTLETTGPKKRILRFTDDKLMVKALATIMYHCFIHPKFPGAYRLDKNKKRVQEDGFDVYADQIDWWVKFFVANCDAVVEGTKIQQVAKVIIRK